MAQPLSPRVFDAEVAVPRLGAALSKPALPRLLASSPCSRTASEKPTVLGAGSPELLPPALPLESAFRRSTSAAALTVMRKCRGLQPCFVVRRILKILGLVVVAAVFVMGLFGWPAQWIDSEQVKEKVMTLMFLVGLVLVILEDHVGVNKASVMLMVSVSMWTFLAAGYHPHESKEGQAEMDKVLSEGLLEVGQLILFLMPAMGVVESIDHFGGFTCITRVILLMTGTKKHLLMPLLTIFVFFLSAVIDNLTATIVALKLLRHVAGEDRNLRHTCGGLVVIAANAGGAWSPVGDVTTTMLWLGDKISVVNTVKWLFLPSFVAGVFPMLGLYWQACRSQKDTQVAEVDLPEVRRANVLTLVLGLTLILMVPVLKTVTGLPPYLWMLASLGILWFVTDTAAFHHIADLPAEEGEDQEIGASPRTPVVSEYHQAQHQARPGSVVEALHQMDLTGLLFFAGVLLAVGALDAGGVLKAYAKLLVRVCGNSPVAITSLLGLSSAVVDNVPLVQASIDMFSEYPTDSPLWQLTALASGTGGSILSVGSIAGVTLMTMEGVGYVWYVRRISLWALLGFVGGIATYQAERLLFL